LSEAPFFYLHMKYLSSFAVLLLAFAGQSVVAEETVSRAEYDALLKRVEALEQQYAAVSPDAVAEAVVAKQAASSPEQKESFMDSVVDAVNMREEAANYPWMEAAKWDQLAKGMSEKEVRAILGEPTMDDPSLHKRVDTVYTYRGRRVATGELVKGYVKFYKKKCIVIERPKL